MVIGLFLNASAVTYYAIAGSLINYGRTFVSLVTDTLYPSATRMDAQQDLKGLRELQIVGTQIALAVAVPVCLASCSWESNSSRCGWGSLMRPVRYFSSC